MFVRFRFLNHEFRYILKAAKSSRIQVFVSMTTIEKIKIVKNILNKPFQSKIKLFRVVKFGFLAGISSLERKPNLETSQRLSSISFPHISRLIFVLFLHIQC